MAFTDLGTDVANVLYRAGKAFITDDDGTTYYDLGRIRDVIVEFTPNELEPDTTGGVVVNSWNMEITLIMTQTSADEIGNFSLLAGTILWVKLTDGCETTATAGAANGKEFKNVTLIPGLRLDFNGGESTIPVTIKGRVSAADITSFGTTDEITLC